ncbi:uncharacterized protein LOC144357018 [Saccoglossus kowalevskii]
MSQFLQQLSPEQMQMQMMFMQMMQMQMGMFQGVPGQPGIPPFGVHQSMPGYLGMLLTPPQQYPLGSPHNKPAQCVGNMLPVQQTSMQWSQPEHAERQQQQGISPGSFLQQPSQTSENHPVLSTSTQQSNLAQSQGPSTASLDGQGRKQAQSSTSAAYAIGQQQESPIANTQMTQQLQSSSNQLKATDQQPQSPCTTPLDQQQTSVNKTGVILPEQGAKQVEMQQQPHATANLHSQAKPPVGQQQMQHQIEKQQLTDLPNSQEQPLLSPQQTIPVHTNQPTSGQQAASTYKTHTSPNDAPQKTTANDPQQRIPEETANKSLPEAPDDACASLELLPHGKFLELFKIKLACEDCIFKHGSGVNSYKVGGSKNHSKKGCKKTILCCCLNNGKDNLWRIVRKKPEKIPESLCQEAEQDEPCGRPPGKCPFAYTLVERQVWLAEQKGIFNRKELFPSLNDNAAIMTLQRRKEASAKQDGSQVGKKQEKGGFSQQETKIRTEVIIQLPNSAKLADQTKSNVPMDEKKNIKSEVPFPEVALSNEFEKKAPLDESKDTNETDIQEQADDNDEVNANKGKTDDKEISKNDQPPESGGDWYQKNNATGDEKKDKKKKKKKEKNKEAEKKHAERSQDVIPEALKHSGKNTMTVNFSVWMSPDFGYDSLKHEVVIRCSLPEFGGWSGGQPCVKMMPTETIIDELQLFKGELVTEPRYLQQEMEYKYVLVKGPSKKESLYEYIPYHNNKYGNRILKIPVDKCKAGGDWNRYDDVMYPEHGSNWWGKIKKTFSSYYEKVFGSGKLALENKTFVTKFMLPSWNGFCVPEDKKTVTPGLAFDAISKVQQILHGINQNYKPYGFDFKKMLVEYLTPKLETFKKFKSMDEETAEQGVQRLASALAIITLIEENSLFDKLDYCIVGDLFEALLIRPNFEKSICHDFEGLEHHFPGKEQKNGSKSTGFDNATIKIMTIMNSAPTHNGLEHSLCSIYVHS